MPGINLAVSANMDLQSRKAELERLQDTMKHDLTYQSTVLLAQDRLFLGFTGYDEYPVSTFQRGDCFILLEGWVYNKNLRQIQNELSELAALLATGKNVASQVRSWILDADGDYIVLILDRARNQLFFFNDALGRLPLYYHQGNGLFLLSREVKFITAMMPDYEYDRFGIAETLLLGYTLGYSTLIRNVHRLDAGVLVSVDLQSRDLEINRTYQFDFDALLDKPPRSVKEHAKSLADRFLHACENLKASFPEYAHVVSLSGGFDSRSVLAGMKRVDAPVTAFTFQDAGTDSRGRDARYAGQVAQVLDVDWQLVKRPVACTDDIEQLLWMKDGMNHAGMAFLLPLHRWLRDRSGRRVLHLTGDNGDRSMDPQGPPLTLKTFDHFCRFVIERHTRIEADDVATITGLSKQSFVDRVYQKLNRYPEKDMNNRYRHFILAERLLNWNFQAEERNRTYFWHATPFSSFPYFEYAMGVPDTAKRNWRLFEEFMRLVNPKCLDVHYANWEAPITSHLRYWNPFKQSIYERLPAWLRVFIRDRTLYRGLTVEASLMDYFEGCLSNLDHHAGFLNVEATSRYIKRCNANSFNNILTFVTYMKLHSQRISDLKKELMASYTRITEQD